MYEIVILAIFIVSLFIIFWAMIGYPIFIIFLGKIFKKRKHIKDYNYEPTVTILVVAHNEEKVIGQKLKNLKNIDYPKNKLEIIVSSDNSTDNTNAIVERFIKENNNLNYKLFIVKERKGKTNAQNEAQKLVSSEILIMTDANSMFKENAVRELVSSFSKDDIKYVCGKLEYTNDDNYTANMESTYWNLDLKMREAESNIQTITAGNGAIYAVRNESYIDVPLISSHDSAFPLHFGRRKERAIFNKDAIAYEKAGESNQDEFKRKVRMNRSILKSLFTWLNVINIFKYKWFTIFYLGHRTSRNLLWLMHLLLLISNIMLAMRNKLFLIILISHLLVYFVALFQQIFKTKFRIFRFTNYYIMTIIAQWMGVYNTITRKNKPFWEKAESTR